MADPLADLGGVGRKWPSTTGGALRNAAGARHLGKR